MSASLIKEMQDNIEIKKYEISEKKEEIALLKTIILSEYEEYKIIEGKAKEPTTKEGKALFKSIKEQNALYEEKKVEIGKLKDEIKDILITLKSTSVAKGPSARKGPSITRRVSKTGFKILKSKKKSKSSSSASASASSSKTPSRSKSSSASKITPAKCTHLDINFIDEWIGKESAKLVKGKGEMYSNRKVPSTDKSLKGYEIVNNAADGSCLIHSFLTAASENYRNLSKVNKATVGLRFRSDVYAELFSDKDRMIIVESDYNRMGGEIMKKLDAAPVEGGYSVLTQPYLKFVGGGHGYLYDKDTENLSKCFGMNIITLVQKGSTVKMDESRYISCNDDNKPYIILYQSGAHYETVYIGAQFVFTNAEMLPIITALIEARPKTVLNFGDFKPGQHISYTTSKGDKKRGEIIEIKFGDEPIESIVVKKKLVNKSNFKLSNATYETEYDDLHSENKSYINSKKYLLPKGFSAYGQALTQGSKKKTLKAVDFTDLKVGSAPIIGFNVYADDGEGVRLRLEGEDGFRLFKPDDSPEKYRVGDSVTIPGKPPKAGKIGAISGRWTYIPIDKVTDEKSKSKSSSTRRKSKSSNSNSS